MSSWLYVGKLDHLPLVDPVAEFVRASDTRSDSRGLTKLLFSRKARHAANENLVMQWFGPEKPIASLCIFNLASIVFFLEHTAQLEGLASANDAITQSRWTNLPYWIDSVWLPIAGQPKVKVQDIQGMPAFLGTTSGLLADLIEINSLSPMRLNSIPPYYEAMRQDPVNFFRNQEMEVLEESDILRWLWLSLFDASTLANEHQVPLISA